MKKIMAKLLLIGAAVSITGCTGKTITREPERTEAAKAEASVRRKR